MRTLQHVTDDSYLLTCSTDAEANCFAFLLRHADFVTGITQHSNKLAFGATLGGRAVVQSIIDRQGRADYDKLITTLQTLTEQEAERNKELEILERQRRDEQEQAEFDQLITRLQTAADQLEQEEREAEHSNNNQT